MRENPIITLTMNPAVDVSSSIATLDPFQKLRCSDVRHYPGGGGINISRVLARLGSPTLAIFPCGGAMGSLFTRLLTDEEVPHISIPIAGDTREDFSVDETRTGNQFRFILPGPVLSTSEIKACMEAVTAQLRRSSFIVASGSLSPGTPVDFYAQLVGAANAASAHLVLDTSGAPLRAAIDHGGLFLIKPSQTELAELSGKPVTGRNESIGVARDIVSRRQAQFVCVSLGAEGALLVGKGCVLFARAPAIAVKTTIGAGDSLLAALVWAFARQATPAEALKLAVAAGTASLLVAGTGLCALEDIQRLETQIHVEHLEQTAWA